ncbi:MAG: BglII/BstYI family type II restriction endonuclease [Pseudomonadota bacterium]
MTCVGQVGKRRSHSKIILKVTPPAKDILYVSDMIDVGIKILPMKEMEKDMSSGVPYYERDLLSVIRQGRGVRAVPLVLLGVVP